MTYIVAVFPPPVQEKTAAAPPENERFLLSGRSKTAAGNERSPAFILRRVLFAGILKKIYFL